MREERQFLLPHHFCKDSIAQLMKTTFVVFAYFIFCHSTISVAMEEMVFRPFPSVTMQRNS